MLKLTRQDLLRTQSYIDGAWVDADDKATLAVDNPANGERVADVASVGATETRRAIEAAHKAWPSWRATSALERSRILRRWYDLMVQHADDLAALLTAEQGKPLAESRGEIMYGASFIEWFAEQAKRINGDTIPAPGNDKRIVVTKQPVGVVASITPWNFPNAMIARKVGPALATGCTFVGKPASETPLSALAMAVLGEEAGIPKGVLNLVVGENAREIGEEMTSNPLVRKLTFTGSTAVGKQLMEQCAGTVKKTTMELGGNAPFIVFDDADLDAAVEGAMASKYRVSGQTCVCANRFLVHESIYDTFAERLTEAVQKKYRLGDGADENTNLGPLIHEKACKKVQEMVEDAVQKGAKALTGGKVASLGKNYYEPTVLVQATRDMRLFKEEIFGPVAPLFKFSTEEEAIAMANDTEYGLAAYFYSRDIGRVWRVSEGLEYGIVGINEGLISNAMAPFGGMKESGTGREGSEYGVDDYLEIKYLCMGGLES
jgi:succinate-semialdehyde dehydrogenase/glutarate-semialdehyde dehydrogenase